jgi:ribosome-binding factor A
MADGRTRSRKALSLWPSLCDEHGADDGVDPRLFFGRKHQSENHRARRLCVAARRALALCLPSALGEAGRSLAVESVEPASQPGSLLVVLRVDHQLEFGARRGLVAALESARGALRAELGWTIKRRRIPDLTFLVLGPEDERS